MKRLLSVALMVLVTLVGMVGLSRGAELQNIQQSMCPVIECISVSALQATAKATDGAVGMLQATVNDGGKARAKMYYLTVNGFTGGDAIKACDPRFHMASISEIQDPSNLQYVNRSTSVYDSLVDDQGLGSPSNRMGWVRSGVYPPSGFAYPCDVYLSGSDQQSGTTMSLYAFWYDPTAVADPNTPHTYMGWHAAHHPCSEPEPVWCVEDPE
jgi:hypothetical protein